jgi:hypothetical protein
MGIEDKVKEEQDEIEIESDIPNNTTKKIAGGILGISALGMAITGYFVKDELSKGISYFMSGFTTASLLYAWACINKNSIKCGHPDCERARENAKKIYKASGIKYPSPEDDPCVSFKPHLMSKSCTKYKKYDGK